MNSTVKDNKNKCYEKELCVFFLFTTCLQLKNVKQIPSRHSDLLKYSNKQWTRSIQVKVERELSSENTNLHSLPDISFSVCGNIFYSDFSLV